MTPKEFKQNARNFQIVWDERERAYFLYEDYKKIDGLTITSPDISDLEERIRAITKVEHNDGETIAYISAHTIAYKF